MAPLTAPLNDRRASGSPPGIRREGGAHLVASIVERAVLVHRRTGASRLLIPGLAGRTLPDAHDSRAPWSGGRGTSGR